MQLSVGPVPSSQDLKCILALEWSGEKYERVPVDEKHKHCGPNLLVQSQRIFSANAICTYVSAANQKASLLDDDLAVNEWVEWEETQLEPLVAKLRTGKNPQLVTELTQLLEGVKSAFNRGQFMVCDQFTLADIVVSVTLKEALTHIEDLSSLASLANYIDQTFASPLFQKIGQHETTQTTKPTTKVTAMEGALQRGETYDSMLSLIQFLCNEAMTNAFPSLQIEANVSRTKKSENGDYQCNSAMSIFKSVKSATLKSPRDVAAALLAAMPENKVIDRLSVAGPGFINIYLKPTFLASRVQTLLLQGVHALPCKKLRVAVDFSSPNIAKDMHVGHLRSTIIGDAMCRLLEFQGHEVLRINHVGDWGTQFGMLICFLMEEFPNWEVEPPAIQDLTALYKQAKLRFDEDAEFKQRSRDKVVHLQSGDAHALKVWEVLCKISLAEFQKVYDRLNVRLSECGESFYNDKIPGVIELLEQKQLTQDSDGALVVFTEKFKQPLMMRKRDGSFLYDSTDMAAIWYRLTQLQADWLIYYTDFSQNDHFQLFFEVARMAGIVDETKHRIDHVGFGTVNDESGKRFKTRSGEVVRLVDLLDEAKARMQKILMERIASGQTLLPVDKVDEAASKIGYGAVKYFDLSQSPTSNYIFSYDRMLSTTGDTAVYLLFAYARFSSIVRKSNQDMDQLKSTHTMVLSDPQELSLAAELIAFQDTLELVKKDLMSNRLCNYLFTVANKVQSFSSACRVLGSPEQNSRLLLCQATLDVMAACFNLLGIEPLDQI